MDIFTIKIKDEIGTSIEVNTIAKDLIEKIILLGEDEVIVDWEGVEFVGMGFARDYILHKFRIETEIHDHHVSNYVCQMFNIMYSRLLYSIKEAMNNKGVIV